MKTVWAIARMTLQEGLRMRLVLVLILLLVFVVLRLPFALRGDETLAGRLQTFLSYSLSALSVLMGLAVVFFSCATLTGEIRSSSLHLVLTKPVNRFQVLAGKWIGVSLLSLLMVALAGGAIYALAVFIKTRPAQFARDRVKLEEVVWTARQAARPRPPDFDAAARQRVDQMLQEGRIQPPQQSTALEEVRRELALDWMRIRPGYARQYRFEGLAPPAQQQVVYQVRFKARGIPYPRDEMIDIGWVIFDPDTGAPIEEFQTRDRHGEVHEFLVRSDIARDGRAVIGVVNPAQYPNETMLWFEGEDGLLILYRVGSFEANYLKSLLFIFLRLAFLAALGLFFGTFVSFPVACFCVLSIYLFCIGMPWWIEAMDAHLKPGMERISPWTVLRPLFTILIPAMRAAFPDFNAYDGIARLIDGQYIPAGQVVKGAAHTLIYGVVLLALPGWLIFRSREIAQSVT